MLILLGLILVLLFFGLGFTLHALWIVAIVLFVAWLVGLLIGRGEERAETTSIGGDRGVQSRRLATRRSGGRRLWHGMISTDRP